ncbi:MAG: carboxylesterase/lipase family protein [Sandaracinaceae bacterium]
MPSVRAWWVGSALIAASFAVGCDGTGGSDAGAADGGVDAGALPPPMVTTSLGPVVGDRVEGAIDFLGIPFAEPPVGDLRFAPPQPAEPWTDPRPSIRPPRCVQAALGLDLDSQEDCLYLNVHTPDPLPTNAPVMVWIHGGAFLFGEGLQTDDGTRGDRLAAEHGVIVVSMNYRLGALGFLSHPELADALGGASGNFGLMDQRLAMQWVRDNIAAFGGDPANITLFGESAGGISVCAHLAAQGSHGLYDRAISESGLCDDPYVARTDAQARGDAYATDLGCTTPGEVVSCLRSKTPEELLAADPSQDSVISAIAAREMFWVSVDGTFLTETFHDAAVGGRVADVPIVMGWNGDEGSIFVLLAEQTGEVVDENTYMTVSQGLADANGVSVDDVRAAYPIADYDDVGAAVAALAGDASLACPSRRAVRLLAENGREVYAYHFEYPDAAFQIPSTRPLGAFHSAEVQFVFGHPSAIGQTRFRSEDERQLNTAISGYWTSFAGGDLNAGATVTWPRYDAAMDRALIFDRTIAVGDRPSADRCAVWEP